MGETKSWEEAATAIVAKLNAAWATGSSVRWNETGSEALVTFCRGMFAKADAGRVGKRSAYEPGWSATFESGFFALIVSGKHRRPHYMEPAECRALAGMMRDAAVALDAEILRRRGPTAGATSP